MKKSHTKQPGRKTQETVRSVRATSPATTRLTNRGTNISRTSVLPSGWRFVSKYQNRSNGGIPIFSEERLQERREKVRLGTKDKMKDDVETFSISAQTMGITKPDTTE